MARKFFIILAAAIILSLVHNGKESLDNLLFNLRLTDRASDEKKIKDAVRDYNRYSARFYSMGGMSEGLNEIPAAPLLKRRLFKDINMFKRDGLVMVFDRDREEVKKVYFINRQVAVAETREVWFLALEDFKTRKRVLGPKGSEIGARYVFRKEDRGWIIHDVDVYPASERIPRPDMESVL